MKPHYNPKCMEWGNMHDIETFMFDKIHDCKYKYDNDFINDRIDHHFKQ